MSDLLFLGYLWLTRFLGLGPAKTPAVTPGPVEEKTTGSGHEDWFHRIFDGFTWTQGGVIIAALIAASGVAATIIATSNRARRDRLTELFADALSGVSEYIEGPYRIRRRTDGDAGQRFDITAKLSDTKARIDHSQNMLRLHARTGVADAFDAYVHASRREAGQQMHEAWKVPGIRNDADVNLYVPFPREESDRLCNHTRAVMQADLARRWYRPGAKKKYNDAVRAARTAAAEAAGAAKAAAATKAAAAATTDKTGATEE